MDELISGGLKREGGGGGFEVGFNLRYGEREFLLEVNCELSGIL